jgi:hypothetical protein
MADQNAPNDASRKDKAEGDRWTSDNEPAGSDGNRNDTARGGAGISNRPLEEERDGNREGGQRRSER